MGLGKFRQAPVGLASEDDEGQAEEEQRACRGNSATESTRRLKNLLPSVCLCCRQPSLRGTDSDPQEKPLNPSGPRDQVLMGTETHGQA